MTTQGLSTENMRAKWDAAWQQFESADEAMVEYIDATDPIYFHEANPAYAVPKHVEEHRAQLWSESKKCIAKLMALPAPDLVALRWKLDWAEGEGYEAGHLAQMRADMDRLMGPSTVFLDTHHREAA